MSETLQNINDEFFALFGAKYRLVPGEGNPAPSLVLVGEAPGRQEEEQGRPFVGKAGQNLSEFLAQARLTREALYITNAVKFRPTREGASGRLSNRTPTSAEVEAFVPWLRRELACTGARAVATLGNTALRAVLLSHGLQEEAKRIVIGDVHGQPMPLPAARLTLFPLYHPASIIYRRELRAVYEEDVRALAAFLTRAAPGSEN